MMTAMRNIGVILVATMLPVIVAEAATTARVDRADIELNESFTLEVTTDTNIDLQPDVALLEQDFYVGQGSQLSNTTITNGQIRRSKTWTYTLMPKRAGELVIPPVAIGNEQSNPVTIVVSEPSYAPPGEADVFITSEVDFEETYVQAQVLLTVKIYRSVATRQPALRDPTATGVDVLVELVGDDRSYEAVINGTAYSVVERVFALYPQESGEIQLSPARFEARVLRNGRITGRKVYESDAHTITVLPVPAPPDAFPDAVWLPARDLKLFEDWSREADQVTAGEPLTRHVTVSVLGQLETQIPAIEPPAAPGINVYPDKPDLNRIIEADGIRGIRKDQYALIGVTAGAVTLPALELPWWNIEVGEWQVARLPEHSLTILPSGEPSAAAAPSAAPEATGADATAVPGPQGGGWWRRAAELLAALWLVTLVAWWWSSRPRRKPREPEPVPLHKQQARFLKAGRKAALAGDAAEVRKALIGWGALQWPEDAPRSIGAIASRVSAPLADELRTLSSLSYGPGGGAWDGNALAQALRSFSVIEDEDRQQSELLPPLMPIG
ncbi:MAG: BatD family protein [Gammaproteobacteria bacterium]|nr:BatD family protein [Gammaproteobacteria bacterium]